MLWSGNAASRRSIGRRRRVEVGKELEPAPRAHRRLQGITSAQIIAQLAQIVDELGLPRPVSSSE
jgi:hypothetical protein